MIFPFDFNRIVERETGFEPATSTLARIKVNSSSHCNQSGKLEIRRGCSWICSWNCVDYWVSDSSNPAPRMGTANINSGNFLNSSFRSSSVPY